MANGLYIGRGRTNNIQDGGMYVSTRNCNMIKDIVGEDNFQTIQMNNPSLKQRAINMLFLQSYGHEKNIFQELKTKLNSDCDFIFFDGSIYGSYVKLCSKNKAKVITFYHNVEHHYYWSKFKLSNNPMDLVMFLYVWFNERLATKYSDKIITLNERDSMELKKIYGRSADFLFPISFDDYSPVRKINSQSNSEKYLLFVGTNFFANIEGISWFIKEVSKNIQSSVWIVGSCCESLKSWINNEEYPNIKLKGFVDNIVPVYENASAVICPIFSGSGMKTKTIEALKFGKHVFGTKEAFEGIHVDYDKVGGLCEDANTYIDKICKFERETKLFFNEYSYSIFKERYSNEVVFRKITEFINEPN